MNNACEVCGTPHRLGILTLRGQFEFTLCVWCREDEPKFRAWLEGEFEKALEADPNAVRQPDGKWKFVDA